MALKELVALTISSSDGFPICCTALPDRSSWPGSSINSNRFKVPWYELFFSYIMLYNMLKFSCTFFFLSYLLIPLSPCFSLATWRNSSSYLPASFYCIPPDVHYILKFGQDCLVLFVTLHRNSNIADWNSWFESCTVLLDVHSTTRYEIGFFIDAIVGQFSNRR